MRDAHGLYIETLAELGPLGLILLLGALVVPLTVLGQARKHPLVPGAAGAYAAYLVHTGVDWDWELPAVTLAGLLCGAAILVAARRSFRSPRLSAPARWTGVVVIVVAAGFAAVGLVGNTALSRSNDARQKHDWAAAAGDARRAEMWMPWSPRPWEALGRAQLGAGLLPPRGRASEKPSRWIPETGSFGTAWPARAGAAKGDTHSARPLVSSLERSSCAAVSAQERSREGLDGSSGHT